jgi:small-conductance mechanosensitive channel
VDTIWQEYRNFIAPLALVIVLFSVLWGTQTWVGRHKTADNWRLYRQIMVIALWLIAALGLLLVLPLEASTRDQLIGLFGLVITALLTLSSTTFVANGMAGWMLRSVRSFAPGDFIRVADHFGRVTERGFLHTEIQTEDRDLTTLPNLYLITNPYTVVRSSGTMISSTVSLGYDQPGITIEGALLDAARVTGLQDPYVLVEELGDFAVTWRVSGFLNQPTLLLSTRSRLNQAILEVLHGQQIEIVSPTYMNQRQLEAGKPVIPQIVQSTLGHAEEAPEARIFDKADAAETREAMRREHARLKEQLKALKSAASPEEETSRKALEMRMRYTEYRIEALGALLQDDKPDEGDN